MRVGGEAMRIGNGVGGWAMRGRWYVRWPMGDVKGPGEGQGIGCTAGKTSCSPTMPAEFPMKVALWVIELRMLFTCNLAFETTSGCLAPSWRPHMPPILRPYLMFSMQTIVNVGNLAPACELKL